MLCKILIINMLDYKFKRFIFNYKVNVVRKCKKKITFATYSSLIN